MVRRLMESDVVRLIRRGSRLLWEVRIWECTAPSVADARAAFWAPTPEPEALR